MKSPWYSEAVQRHALAGGPSPLNGLGSTLFLGLHSEDPSGQDYQMFHVVAAVGYVPIARESASWISEAGEFRNAKPLTFAPAKTDGTTQTARFWTLGTSDSRWIVGGKLDQEQQIVEGMSVRIPAGQLRSSEF